MNSVELYRDSGRWNEIRARYCYCGTNRKEVGLREIEEVVTVKVAEPVLTPSVAVTG